jgi:biopolymer transport protein ExbB/TolQ
MEEFLKMDVFFVVTTLAVIIVSVLLGIALYYIIRILRNVEHVSERVAEESDNIQSDLRELRANIRKEGAKMKHFAEFFGGIVRRSSGRAKRSKDTPA